MNFLCQMTAIDGPFHRVTANDIRAHIGPNSYTKYIIALQLTRKRTEEDFWINRAYQKPQDPEVNVFYENLTQEVILDDPQRVLFINHRLPHYQQSDLQDLFSSEWAHERAMNRVATYIHDSMQLCLTQMRTQLQDWTTEDEELVMQRYWRALESLERSGCSYWWTLFCCCCS